MAKKRGSDIGGKVAALRRELDRQEAVEKYRNERCPPAEKRMIQEFLARMPREITIEENKILAKLFTRHPKALQLAIEAARAAFISQAQFYIEKHREAVAGAVKEKDFATAASHAEWAIERLGTKEGGMLLPQNNLEQQSSGPKIMVGVQIGGVKPTPVLAIDSGSSEDH